MRSKNIVRSQITSVAALQSWNGHQAESGDSDTSTVIDASDWCLPVSCGGMYNPPMIIAPPVLDTLTTSTDTSAPKPIELPGTLLQLKRVDEVYDPMRGGWVARDSAEQQQQISKDAYEAYAFTLTRRFDQSRMNSTLTVDVRSEWLRSVGKDVVGSVNGISWTAKPLKINPQVLIAFLPALEEHALKLRAIPNPTAEDSTKLSHLDFFISSLRSEYEETLTELSSLLSHDEITFELLYALLVPGSIVYLQCPVSGAPRTVRLISVDMQAAGNLRFWQVVAEYVEFDSGVPTGRRQRSIVTKPQIGFANLNSTITGFKGAKKITSLPVYPLRYFPASEDLKTRLVNRGKKWLELQTMHHKYHNGIAFYSKNGYYVKVHCNSRVMVDRVTFSQTMPNYSLPSLTKDINGEEIVNHTPPHAARMPGTLDIPEFSTPGPDEWTDELLMQCSPLVYGFSLTDKLWLEFNVENISSFEWNDEPFENLVLEHNAKNLVRSLVEAHGHDNAGFDDFVEGKGQGLVINLFGNPGVGKTLTAEATSEYVRKPLYIVGAADLGTKSSVLDANLTRIFSLSSTWDAVVLIDEADVFLEERSLHDLERNAMVAVFLRQLEYFRGILFLTTNRVRTFDRAFQSRIHVSLRYQGLTNELKEHLWVAFVKKAHSLEPNKADTSLRVDLTESELKDLGSRKVNGRQIKNAVRTACALARSSEEVVGYKHLVQVLSLMEAFELDVST